jgi:hypothetical protein
LERDQQVNRCSQASGLGPVPDEAQGREVLEGEPDGIEDRHLITRPAARRITGITRQSSVSPASLLQAILRIAQCEPLETVEFSASA